MGSKIMADLQEVMNRGVTFSILELKGILRVRGHGNFRLSGLKTSRGYLLTIEKDDLFFEIIVEGEERYLIKSIQRSS